jgi:DNA-binding transcriptional regulator YhcF (GntR family)
MTKGEALKAIKKLMISFTSKEREMYVAMHGKPPVEFSRGEIQIFTVAVRRVRTTPLEYHTKDIEDVRAVFNLRDWAKTLNIAYETAQRYCRRLVKEGYMETYGKEHIVRPSKLLLLPEVRKTPAKGPAQRTAECRARKKAELESIKTENQRLRAEIERLQPLGYLCTSQGNQA